MPDTPLADEADDKWIYKKHTRAKHEVLHYYLKVWTSIVSNENYDLKIFDCFAGRGDYVDTDGAEPIELDNITSDANYPGSPVLTLDAVSKHADKFRNAECYFMEPNGGNRDVLRDTLENTSSPDNVNPHVLNKRFPDDIPEVVRRTRAKGGFAFFFIDPFNIKHLDYQTVTEIAGTSRFDCLLTVMTSQLIRWQDSEAHQEGYQRFFGLENWRSRLSDFVPEELTTREAEFYCNRLEENGPQHTLAYMTTDGDTRELKYHLVFTTNDPKGMQAMKGSMVRCGGQHTLAYAPNRAEFKQGQQTFEGGKFLTNAERARAWLLSRFAGETVSFGELSTRSMAERTHDDSLVKDYREYLQSMHDDGDVQIPQRDSPGGPLPDHYQIHFPEVELSD